jgi:tRNA A37 threonylcarbamoyladenosine modification protein TsaB
VILVVSTSFPLVSLAFYRDGELVFSQDRLAPRGASQAVIEMAEASQIPLSLVELFVADGGPGSFTGVKVATAMAKTWAWSYGRPAGVVSAFDLAETPTDVLPARKGHVYRLHLDGTIKVEPSDVADFPLVHARFAAPLLAHISPVHPQDLVPIYGGLPNVSVSKNAVIMGGHGS